VDDHKQRAPRCQPGSPSKGERDERVAEENKSNDPKTQARRPNQPTKVERDYGDVIPDTSDGIDLLKVTVFHMAFHRNASRNIPSWLELRAPWLDADEQREIAEEAMAAVAKGIRIWGADKLGSHIKVSIAEREAWGLTTIGAVNDSKAKRAARRKANKRDKEAARRAAKGATPRNRSKAQTRPWAALGMSESTWYAKGQPAPPAESEAWPVKKAVRNLGGIRGQRLFILLSTKQSESEQAKEADGNCGRAGRYGGPKVASQALGTARNSICAEAPRRWKRSFL
jgi:hypothetical protein